MRIAVALAVAAALALAAPAAAQMTMTGVGGTTGGSGPPPTCSNKLDFTAACNSQYAGVF